MPGASHAEVELTCTHWPMTRGFRTRTPLSAFIAGRSSEPMPALSLKPAVTINRSPKVEHIPFLILVLLVAAVGVMFAFWPRPVPPRKRRNPWT